MHITQIIARIMIYERHLCISPFPLPPAHYNLAAMVDALMMKPVSNSLLGTRPTYCITIKQLGSKVYYM